MAVRVAHDPPIERRGDAARTRWDTVRRALTQSVPTADGDLPVPESAPHLPHAGGPQEGAEVIVLDSRRRSAG
ncbi:hypothetical protein GCM10025787_41720 [Saccharopolyspora rosea]